MAKKRASTKKPAPADTRPQHPYSFRTYDDNMGGFAFALVKGDGTVLMNSGPASFKTRKAAEKSIGEVVLAIQGGNVPMLDAKDR